MNDDPRLEDLIEIYAAAGAVEADRIVLLLEEDGIEALARETTMSSFPSPGSHLILVREKQKAQARTVLEEARRDGAIGETGAFL